jgi:branched-chain amino acid transport system ATP-binding protein
VVIESRQMSILEVEHVDTFYGPSHVLFDICLSIDSGEAVGLLGRNGAGKSTTLKGIIGLVPPREGVIRFRGRNIVGLSPYQMCRMGVGYVPEDRRIFRGLTVKENLEIARRSPPNQAQVIWDLEQVSGIFPILKSLASRRGEALSGGEQQMLCIARALMSNPTMLLVDEPSEGLAPVVIRELQKQIQNLKAADVTILLSEQNFRFTTQVVDRIYIIEKGQIKYESTPQELESNTEIRRKYLSV